MSKTFLRSFTRSRADLRLGSSNKRPLITSEPSSSKKVKTVHPFFTKAGVKPQEDGPFQWQDSLGSHRTCLYGVNLQPKPTTKVAAFDLDGTLIKGGFQKAGVTNWEWWNKIVPSKMREMYDNGYAIVIISNQGIKPVLLQTWKQKIASFAKALPEVPFYLFAASAKDQFRKPMPGMWQALELIFRADGIESIDKAASLFVGDAAGRQFSGTSADFAGTDRKWAINVGLPFKTPEEFFLGAAPHTNYKLEGFDVATLPTLPLFTPTSTPLVPQPPHAEVILFVGYPALGKSSFYRRHLEAAGYAYVNQDTLKSLPKCLKAVKESLERGQRCAVDNTNRDFATRKHYIDLATTFKVPIRCFHFTGSIDLAWHNNLYRAFNLPPSLKSTERERSLLVYGVFTGFRDKFQEPSLDEGFSEIKKINWVFEGSEEERRYWSMWLQISGK